MCVPDKPTAGPRLQQRGSDGGLHDSGTEGDLKWAQHPKIEPEHGRQFVTFNPWQAYPELKIVLEA